SPGVPYIPGFDFAGKMPPQPDVLVRLDYLRLERLKAIADERLPIMVVTPRLSLPRAAISRVNSRWSPQSGQSPEVSLDFVEVRIVSPLTKFIVQDWASQATGNNEATSGASSAGTAAGEAAAPDVAGLAPTGT